MKDVFNLGITPMSPVMIIQKYEQLKTKSSKIKLIKQAWDADSESFFIGLQISMDNNVDFMSEKVPAWEDSDEEDSIHLDFEKFYLFYLKVKNNQYTKDEIKSEILDLAQNAGTTEWNIFYRKILLKRLHIDIEISPIIEALKQIEKNNTKNTNKDVSEILRK